MKQARISSMPPAWMADLLRCPRCRSRLTHEWRCLDVECGLGPFAVTANGVPVLIDFERSAIDQRTISDPMPPGVNRPGRFHRILRRCLKPLAGLTNAAGSAAGVEKAGQALSAVPAPRVLMVGGGERWLGLDRFLALVPAAEIVNSDIYPGAFVHVLTDAHQLAFADESFDMIWVDAVLEHLIEPSVAVEEFWRVLKKDGLVLADTPFLQAVHMGAYDFTRYTPLGQRALFKRFEELDVGISAGPMSALRWSVDYGMKSIFRTKFAAWVARPFTLPLAWIEQFSPSNHYALDACCGSYFVGRKSQRTATPREIVASYKGAQKSGG